MATLGNLEKVPGDELGDADGIRPSCSKAKPLGGELVTEHQTLRTENQRARSDGVHFSTARSASFPIP